MMEDKNGINNQSKKFFYGLGIDAGGTYTDAVIINLSNGKIEAHQKALTTKEDPVYGIRSVLSKLPAKKLGKVDFASLATTFATNAIVEGKGGKAGLILIGYDKNHSTLSNLSPVIFIDGGHDYWGKEVSPLDLEPHMENIQKFVQNIDAIAISGHFSIRNPSHEIKVAEHIISKYDVPVVCGHKLTMQLDAPKRATTAWWNARLIPLISSLIKATQVALLDHDIDCQLMVVKGDGTIMSAKEAIKRPIETILSGPAASIMGAKHLSGVQDGLIVDMGGTTTDMAILIDGKVKTDPEGASVGKWKTHVEAAKIITSGLGGDSYIYTKDGTVEGIDIGPERVEPISIMATKYPEITFSFERFVSHHVVPKTIVRHPCSIYISNKKGAQAEDIPEIMKNKMFYEFHIAQNKALDINPWQLKEIERSGQIIKASLTPTDLCIARGKYKLGDQKAARLAIELFAMNVGMNCKQMQEHLDELIRKKCVCRQ
jgi:N-methylhydantoinase A/oxoprolinase/acetone carboxylase beta subunit